MILICATPPLQFSGPENFPNGATTMIEPLQLSVAQQFDIERLGRAIDSTTHVPDLQALCKQLLQAWQTQKAACAWVMAQGLQPRWSSPDEVAHLMPAYEKGAAAAAPDFPL